jgi:hypothetical protein
MISELDSYKEQLYHKYVKDLLTFYIKHTLLSFSQAWNFYEIKSDVYQRGFSSNFEIRTPFVFRTDFYSGVLSFLSDLSNKKLTFPLMIYEDGIVSEDEHETKNLLEYYAFTPKSTTTDYVRVLDEMFLTILGGLSLKDIVTLDGSNNSSVFTVEHDDDVYELVVITIEENVFKSNYCIKITINLDTISAIYFENLEAVEEEE